MELVGKIKNIGDTTSHGNNGFEKREFVIVTEEQYPQTIQLELQQGNVNLLDRCHEGQKVNVHFTIRGREWVNPEGVSKYFNTLVGWKIEVFT